MVILLEDTGRLVIETVLEFVFDILTRGGTDLLPVVAVVVVVVVDDDDDDTLVLEFGNFVIVTSAVGADIFNVDLADDDFRDLADLSVGFLDFCDGALVVVELSLERPLVNCVTGAALDVGDKSIGAGSGCGGETAETWFCCAC